MAPPPGRVLLAVDRYDPDRWARIIGAGREVVRERTWPEDPSIRYAVAWSQRPGSLSGLPNLKAIFSVGAGVDHLLADPALPDVPIVRVVDPDLTRYMVEYVCWRVLDHQRQGRLYRAQQAQRVWHEPPQPLARDVHVGIMGLGHLGRAAARGLLSLGFRVNGWSRRAQAVDGVACFHGREGLPAFLSATDVLVVLLPYTPDTHGIVDHGLLARLRRDGPLGGAVLINAGRGKLQKDADFLRALEDGTLKEASLDVFEREPLPADSPLWSHPCVFVTPHAAAPSDPDQLAPAMLAQMAAHDRGEPLVNLVDRVAGY